jgi:TonB-dependent SusC/RagA subfamily outer membrane receptor
MGAEIRVKSTKLSVQTDSMGNFVVLSNPEDKLRISARGFYTQNVKIAPNIKVVAVNLKLKPGEKQRQYAIGYGYVSEEDISIAVSGLETNASSFERYNTIYDLIRGQLSGVQITNGEIIIRGAKSFQGSSAALIVVDGVIVDSDFLNSISPIEVKSIDAIKDGGSAIYGSRGANGVILIETWKGGDEVK